MRLRRFASVALASALVAFLIAGCASFPERPYPATLHCLFHLLGT